MSISLIAITIILFLTLIEGSNKEKKLTHSLWSNFDFNIVGDVGNDLSRNLNIYDNIELEEVKHNEENIFEYEEENGEYFDNEESLIVDFCDDWEPKWSESECADLYPSIPVCAVFSMCQEGTCKRKSFDNECFACVDPTVLGYNYGRCKGEMFTCDVRPQNCSEYINRAIYDPVCGKTPNGTKTYETPCQACLDPSVSRYETNICITSIDGIHYCDISRLNAVTIFDTDLVCVYWRDGCPEGLCSVTKKVSTNICGMFPIIYGTDGQCKNESDKRILCTPDDRLETCEVPPAPAQVCAISWMDDGCMFDDYAFLCANTFENKCNACQNSSILAYIPGPCTIPCDYEDILELCNNPSFNPVCGVSYGGNLQSFENACTACRNHTIQKYSSGLCEMDPIIECGGEKPTNCSGGLVNPVCGFFNNRSIETFENECFACKSDQVANYRPGLCPQDLGVYCEENNRPTSCPDPYHQDIVSYDLVCGSTSEDIHVTFESSCLACANSSVVFFNKNSCQGQIKFCNDSNSRNPNEDSPVCAFIPNCGQESCSKTLSNAYSACQISQEASFIPGQCEDIKVYCESSGSVCHKNIDLVCAFYKIGCNETICSNTVTNPCVACLPEGVLYWKPGRCEIESQGRIVVDLNNRPKTCTDEQNPVCGYGLSCGIDYIDNCATTYSNECQARKDENVLSFYPGPCIKLCSTSGIYFFYAAWEPVCALKGDNCTGGDCSKSYLNSFFACKQTGVVSFFDGLCFEDEGMPCSSEYIGFCYGSDPVCGRVGGSQECANDIPNETCWKTFDTLCSACTEGASIFKLGQCTT